MKQLRDDKTLILVPENVVEEYAIWSTIKKDIEVALSQMPETPGSVDIFMLRAHIENRLAQYQEDKTIRVVLSDD